MSTPPQPKGTVLVVDDDETVRSGLYWALTSDYRVLPNGTAFISDIGMCGDYNSVLGMDIEEPINRFLTKIPRQRFEPASGPGTLSGLAVDIDDATGLARACAAFRMGPNLEPAAPAFWS